MAASDFCRGGRPGAHHGDADQCARLRAGRPLLPVLRSARGRKDHHRPDPRKGAQLRQPPGNRSLPGVPLLPQHHRRNQHGRAGDRRGLEQQRRRCPRVARGCPLRPHRRLPQDLHHRRSAHAVDGGIQRPPEDTGRAPGAGRVRLRDHRGSGSTGHDSFPLPAVQFPPYSHRTHCRAPADDLRYRRHRRGSGGSLPAGPTRRRGAQGRGEPDGPGRFVRAHRGHPGGRPTGTGAGGPQRLFRSVRRRNQRRRRPCPSTR